MRDIQRAYRDAMVEEYESLVRGGRKAEAAHVRRQLQARFGVAVGEDETPAPVVERAVEAAAPEAAVEDKPAPRRGPGRPRKTAEAAPDKK